MANICKTTISIVGLKEPPETFVKALSKAMFEIDLDNMAVEKWDNYRCEGGKLVQTYHLIDSDTGETEVYRPMYTGAADTSKCNEGKYYDISYTDFTGTEECREIGGPATWYSEIVKDFTIGRGAQLGVLLLTNPFIKGGVSVPSFYVETKWQTPLNELKKASENFPELLFHVEWFLESDGPMGEFVMQDGALLEETTHKGSFFYLFDHLRYPTMSLLPKYMTLTLAQRGAAAVEDAITLIEGLHFVLHDGRFTDSRYQPLRDQRKFEETRQTLDALLAHMEEAAKSLTFEGVFLPDKEEVTTEVGGKDWTFMGVPPVDDSEEIPF